MCFGLVGGRTVSVNVDEWPGQVSETLVVPGPRAMRAGTNDGEEEDFTCAYITILYFAVVT